MNMPAPVKTFFDADSRNDADGVCGTFAPDAVVEDENASHHGRDAIRRWWLEAKHASQFVVEPIEASGNDETAVVRGKVSGQFPGSPITLTYTFALQDEHITRLEIR